MKRICIYPKDIQVIIGRGERQCRNILLQIRKHYNKEKHQPITIQEFCEYMGLDFSAISLLIK